MWKCERGRKLMSLNPMRFLMGHVDSGKREVGSQLKEVRVSLGSLCKPNIGY